MSLLVNDCPRCSASKITFDIMDGFFVGDDYKGNEEYEVFSVCRGCRHATIFCLTLQDFRFTSSFKQHGLFRSFDGCLDPIFRVIGHVSVAHNASTPPPDYLPPEIDKVFREASLCQAVGCYNAAATMFRLCLDLATRHLVESVEQTVTDPPNAKQRRDLGLRLPWLFAHGVLPKDLQQLAHCIREDANDGAHAGTLSSEDVQDIEDFTMLLLERLYTEPGRLRMAGERRQARRA